MSSTPHHQPSISQAELGTSPRAHHAGMPYSPRYDDVYHTEFGAWAQARQVFMAGNDLPHRWRSRTRFVILETGFGLGNNFMATWQAWREDPQRCEHLIFISVEKHPLDAAQMRAMHLTPGPTPAPDEDARPALAKRLLSQWPPLTPGWHHLSFPEPDVGTPHARVSLQLGWGDVGHMLPSLLASVDAFYLDGFSPDRNPEMWDPRWLSRLHRLAAPDATAATWSVARPLRDALTQAGFQIDRRQGFGSKRDMVAARFAPRYLPPPPAGGLWPEVSPEYRHAVVVGAGLAGCAAAWALTGQGWQVTLVDSNDGPAREASGNPGGMFHAILHGEDGIHARAHRAAALMTTQVTRPWMTDGRLQGHAQGLLRLDPGSEVEAQALLTKLGLGPDHVHWADPDVARTASGAATPTGGWMFTQGGWLCPHEYAQALLASASATGRLTCRWHQRVTHLSRRTDGWCLGVQDTSRQDPCDDTVWTGLPSVVLANAHACQALLETMPLAQRPASLPGGKVRGQITRVPCSPETGLQVHSLQMPVAGSGYALTLPDGDLLCGATSHHHDEDPTVRETDHRHNLTQAARLGALTSWSDGNPLPAQVQGRVGWRATTPDRLPNVGAVPWSPEQWGQQSARTRQDQPRMVPRMRDAQGGLYVLTGLGSRGITWAALSGQLLAHWVTGSPCPVEADLRDALDPARWQVRAITKAQSTAEPRPASGEHPPGGPSD